MFHKFEEKKTIQVFFFNFVSMLLTFLRNEWNLKQSAYEDDEDDDVIFVAVDFNHYKNLVRFDVGWVLKSR